MIGLISWLLFGLVAGAIAKFVMPGPDPGGILVTMLLGIGGAVLGGWLGSLLFGLSIGAEWNLSSFISAVVGGLIILFAYRRLRR